MSDEADKNGNENCLSGLECPKCHNHKKLLVVGLAQFHLFDDGTDGPIDGVEWEDEAPMTCPECKFDGQVKDFRIKKEEPSGETAADNAG